MTTENTLLCRCLRASQVHPLDLFVELVGRCSGVGPWWELQSDFAVGCHCADLKALGRGYAGCPQCCAWGHLCQACVCLVLGTLRPVTACLGSVDLWEILESSQCEPRLAACVQKTLEGLGLTHELGGVSRSYQCRGEERWPA